MNILIIGNIASGKTTLALALRKQFPHLFQKYCSIDNFRKSFSDGTFAGEFNAWTIMLRQIQEANKNGNGIFEFSGTGKNAWFVRSAIEYSKSEYSANWRVIFCSCEPRVIRERVRDRVYNVPIPYKFDNINDSIEYIGKELRERALKPYFSAPQTIVRTDINNVDAAVKEIAHGLCLK